MAEAPDHGESPSGGPLLGPAVSVKNLQLPFGVLAPNVWGKLKEQPVLVTVVLHLNQGFASAASKDALDENTIHYGELAKQIRAVCTANQTILDILSNVEGVVGEMGKRKDGSFRVSLAAIDINLLKASVFGQMVTVARELRYDNFGQVETSQMSFTVQDTKIMTLIGVNDYERTGPQPVLASLELYMGNGSSSGIAEQHGIDELFNLEHTLANIIQNSSFETLEALSESAMKQLQKELLDQGLSGLELVLRLEKPKAIVFADAAMVQVRAEVPAGESGKIEPPVQKPVVGERTKLRILKPYV